MYICIYMCMYIYIYTYIDIQYVHDAHEPVDKLNKNVWLGMISAWTLREVALRQRTQAADPLANRVGPQASGLQHFGRWLGGPSTLTFLGNGTYPRKTFQELGPERRESSRVSGVH